MRKAVNKHLILHYVSQQKCQIHKRAQCFVKQSCRCVNCWYNEVGMKIYNWQQSLIETVLCVMLMHHCSIMTHNMLGR